MRVSVCIAATSSGTVGGTVRSIVRQTHREWELVVVAQGPATASITAAVHKELGGREGRVIAQPGRGLSRARNAAVAAATGDLIAMIDDDCEAAPDWLEMLVTGLEACPRVGVVGGALVAPPRIRRRPANCPECFPERVLYEPNGEDDRPDGFSLIGANIAFRRSTALAVGPFDEFLGAGGRFPVAEELDFLRRAANLSIAMLSMPEAVVNHTHGWRYGAKAVGKMQRNYARGNGGYAAKKTLLGDPSGHADLQRLRRLTALDWWERRAPVALPAGIVRYYHFAAGYRECLRGFIVGPDDLLRERPREAADALSGTENGASAAFAPPPEASLR